MPRGIIVELTDCSEFRQTLAARPPRIVHGTALLLLILLGAGITWAALVDANLVVRAAGRVRPVEIPTRVFTSASADLEGRVVEAPFDEGDVVRKGDLLVRLDTARIENQIAKLNRTIEASQDELTKLTGLEKLLALQLNSARQKAQAELSQAEQAFALATGRRASDIRRGQAEVKAAEDQYRRARKLADSRTITEQDLVKAENDVRQAREKLVQAELPADDAQVAVARRAVEVVDRDFAVRRGELAARIAAKRGEAEAAQKDLANLNIQRDAAVLRSPIDGIIVAGQIRAGDVLQPGKPVMEIAREQSYRFEAIVPSEDVGNLSVGMPVRIKFDTYDYQKYGVLEGRITYLSPDSKPAKASDSDQETGEQAASRRSPAAYLVRVELHANEVGRGDLRGPVKLGLGGTAEIVTGHESVLWILLNRIRQTISLG